MTDRRMALHRIGSLATAEAEGALLVVGETGIGKSRLLEEACDAWSGGACVLVRVNPGEAHYPFSGLSSLLTSLGDARLGETVPLPPSSTQPADLFAVAHDLLTRLRALHLRPELVLVDDVDRMDPASQAILGFMAGRLAGTGLRLVATATALAADSPLASVPRLELSRLDLEESVELARSLAAAGADEAVLRMLAQHAGGNPRGISEALAHLGPESLTGEAPIVLPPRPAWAADRFEVILGALPRAQMRLLERVALAPYSHSGIVAGDDDEAADLLEDLLAEDVLTANGPLLNVRDPLLRSHLYWRLGSRSRRQLHADLAAAAARVDGALASWHASFVAPGDHGRDLLEHAVTTVDRVGAAAAVEFAERALTLTPDPPARALAQLADHLLALGELAHADRYARRVAAVDDHAVALDLAQVRLVVEFLRTQHVAGGYVDACADLYAGGQPAGVAELLALAALLHAERWELPATRARLATAEAVAPEGEPGPVLTAAKLLADALESRASGDTPLLQQPPSGQLVELPPVALIAVGRSCTLLERYDDARRVYSLALGRLAPRDVVVTEFVRYWAVVNEVRSGNFHQARSAFAAWEVVARPLPARRASRTLLRAWHAYSRRRLTESLQMLDEAAEQASDEASQSATAQVLSLRGNIALSEGDPDEAVKWLRLADAAGWAAGNPALVRHLPDLVEAYALTGRMREAASALRELQERAQRYPSRWAALTLARARALLAPAEAARQAFTQAIDVFQPGDSQYEHGRTLLCFALRLDELGLHAESARARDAARAAFAHAGAQAWSRRLDTEAAPDDAGRMLLELLTPEELEVAQKVRLGYRNKEIADELFVSLRTVELRLTHIYRKVGARSRSHLISLLT